MMRAPNLPDVPIVLGDSDEYSRRLMREMLRAARIRRIHEVSTANDIVKKLQGIGPSIAFIDLELPGLDTRDAMEALEAYTPRSIGMARRVTMELACTAGRMFAGGILVKPCTPSALWLRVLTLMDGMAGIEVAGHANGSMHPAPRRLLGVAGAG